MTPSQLETLPTSQPRLEAAPAETAEAAWRPLYRVGGAAALIAAGLEIAAALIGIISSSSSVRHRALSSTTSRSFSIIGSLDSSILVSSILLHWLFWSSCFSQSALPSDE